MAGWAEARSPFALLSAVDRAQEVLVVTYSASLEFFERFALSDARALGAIVTIVSDAAMVHADPMVVRRSGTHYLDARAICPQGAFHPKLVVVAGRGQARVAIGSGNCTMGGWHANAEVWTTLRADADGGPATLRAISQFLRELADSPVRLSVGADAALERVAARLDELPADEDGPRLVHSLREPIAAQLDVEGPVDRLVAYAPFHDRRLAGLARLLDDLAPREWVIFVNPDTVVDGARLQRLVDERDGELRWIATERPGPGGQELDERYYHGKLVQWTVDGQTFALTGSPNLSRPALLESVAEGGNLELAVVAPVSGDGSPPTGPPPPGGLAALVPPSDAHDHDVPALALLAAIRTPVGVQLRLARAPSVDGIVQRYDRDADGWRRIASLSPGATEYELDLSAASVADAVRVVLDDGSVSNAVFVCDLRRVRQPHVPAVGKARVDPEGVPGSDIDGQLLADLDALRPHLLGARVLVRGDVPTGDDDDDSTDGAAAARPAPGLSMEDFVAACDAVLGQTMTEFALVLPALPGTGGDFDDALGTLDDDSDDPEDPPGDSRRRQTIRQVLEKASPTDRERYRDFVERLVARADRYPMVVRTLAARTLLHAIAAGLWTRTDWPPLLAEAVTALGAPGDEPTEGEREAASALAAVGLGLLRTMAFRELSRETEPTRRFRSAGRATAHLLADVDNGRLVELAEELPARWRGAAGVQAAYDAVADVLQPPTGASRARRFLLEEHGIRAQVADDGALVITDPIGGFADPQIILALALTQSTGPECVRGRTQEGRRVLGAWSSPWVAVERESPSGVIGRAWKLPRGVGPATIHRFDLPRPDLQWLDKTDRPPEVVALLARCDAD